MRIRNVMAILTAFTMALSCNLAAAQADYPSRPIRIVVPSGAGGLTDSLARLLAQQLTTSMGQSVFVENKPGAAGVIGTQFVATAAPDGYNLLMVFPSHVANPSLFTSLPYDTVKSFTPVSLVSNVSMVFVVNQDLPVRNLAEFIAYAKSRPGKLNFASVGAGSLGHLGAEVFNSTAGTNVVHVPYKGSPQAMNALMAKEVDMYLVASANSAIPQMKSGRIRALGVSVKDRLSVLPDVPPMGDTLPGYDVAGWNGVVAPAGTPDAIIARLHREIVKSVRSPEFVRLLANEGATGVASTPQEFAAIIRADIDRWAKVMQAAGVKKE